MRKEGHAPLLIVIAGPNGSGKTTITSEVLASEWLEDVKAQPLFRLRDGDLGKQYVESVPEWTKNILPK